MDTQTIEELVDLKGKAAIITGGASDIGRAIALALAEVGAAVMVADSNLEAAIRTAEEIREQGGYAEAMKADACSLEDANKVAEETFERFGTLDILVNAGAAFSFVPALAAVEDLWNRALRAHAKGVYYYSQAAALRMMEGGRGGRIVNIASIDGMRTVAAPPTGSVAEASVAQVSKALALEFETFKILVNAVAPGAVQTPSAQMQVASISKTGRQLEESARVPMPQLLSERVGDVDQIATIVLFLVSEAGADVTGNLVVVD